MSLAPTMRWHCVCCVALLFGCRRSTNGEGDAVACGVPLPALAASSTRRSEPCPAAPDSGPSYGRKIIEFPGLFGQPRIRVEHAESPAAKRRGLMYRSLLGPDDGMLFSWPRAAIRQFWMRDTCVPLDLIFLSEDDVVVGIIERAAPLDSKPLRVDCPARRVLEVNAGWSRAHGLQPGQRVTVLEESSAVSR